MTDRQDRKAFFRELGKYSALGLEMALSSSSGWDRVLPRPVARNRSVADGRLDRARVAAGVRSLYRAAVRSGKDLERRGGAEEAR